MKSWIKIKAHAWLWVHSIRWLRRVTPTKDRRFSHHEEGCGAFYDTDGNRVHYCSLWYWCWIWHH